MSNISEKFKKILFPDPKISNYLLISSENSKLIRKPVGLLFGVSLSFFLILVQFKSENVLSFFITYGKFPEQASFYLLIEQIFFLLSFLLVFTLPVSYVFIEYWGFSKIKKKHAICMMTIFPLLAMFLLIALSFLYPQHSAFFGKTLGILFVLSFLFITIKWVFYSIFGSGIEATKSIFRVIVGYNLNMLANNVIKKVISYNKDDLGEFGIDIIKRMNSDSSDLIIRIVAWASRIVFVLSFFFDGGKLFKSLPFIAPSYLDMLLLLWIVISFLPVAEHRIVLNLFKIRCMVYCGLEKKLKSWK